jgi:hypothetical protein
LIIGGLEVYEIFKDFNMKEIDRRLLTIIPTNENIYNLKDYN